MVYQPDDKPLTNEKFSRPKFPMNIPILLTAFGATINSNATYSHLDRAIRDHYPDNEIIWSFTSRRAANIRQHSEEPAAVTPEKALQQLLSRGITKVVTQSLHLLPGREFHETQRLVNQAGITSVPAMPLLTTPTDYHEFGEILRPTILAKPDEAILLLGHGTAHPIWIAYCCLEALLRRTFGSRIFVGVLEKFPDSQALPGAIQAAGFSKVCIIPFLLVAGMHYHRDIIGDNPNSWKSRLCARGLAVETVDHGLGLFPGIDKLIIRHLDEAIIRLHAL